MKDKLKEIIKEFNEEYDEYKFTIKKRGTRKYQKVKFDIFINKEKTGGYINTKSMDNLKKDIELYYPKINAEEETLNSVRQYIKQIILDYEQNE